MPDIPAFTKLQLTDYRRAVRRAMAWMLVASATIAALGYLLPAHHMTDGTTHSNYADGGPFPIALFVLVIGATLALRRRGFGSGMLTGAFTTAASIAALMPVVLTHLFFHVEYRAGEHLFGLGELGLFFGGIALVFGEPILYFLERRHLRRLQVPRLPIARVIA